MILQKTFNNIEQDNVPDLEMLKEDLGPAFAVFNERINVYIMDIIHDIKSDGCVYGETLDRFQDRITLEAVRLSEQYRRSGTAHGLPLEDDDIKQYAERIVDGVMDATSILIDEAFAILYGDGSVSARESESGHARS